MDEFFQESLKASWETPLEKLSIEILKKFGKEMQKTLAQISGEIFGGGFARKIDGFQCKIAREIIGKIH